MEELLQVGVITSTHGIRGEVKVFPTTDDPRRFRDLKKVLLDTGKEKRPLEVESARFFKQFVILKFKGIDNINDVEGYRRCPLLVERADAVPLGTDEYFIADMIGLAVEEEDGTPFGRLTEDVYKRQEGGRLVTTTDTGPMWPGSWPGTAGCPGACSPGWRPRRSWWRLKCWITKEKAICGRSWRGSAG